MRASVAKADEILASTVWIDAGMLHVRLKDERVVSVPLRWFPRLENASPKQRDNWRLVGGGVGIHWPDLDEDVSVENLLK